MQLYADYPARAMRQIAWDAGALLTIGGVIALATWVGDRINDLKGFGLRMESAGQDFKETMDAAGETLAGVPLIGDDIAAPFGRAAAVGSSLRQAGIDQQQQVGDLAVMVAFGIAVLPILAVIVMWLVPRIRFAMRASAAGRLARSEAAVDLLALRALLTAPPEALLSALPRPAEAWRLQEPAALQRLAAIELRRSGVVMEGVGRVSRRGGVRRRRS